MRYSHFMYKTYPIPTASLVTMELFECSLINDVLESMPKSTVISVA